MSGVIFSSWLLKEYASILPKKLKLTTLEKLELSLFSYSTKIFLISLCSFLELIIRPKPSVTKILEASQEKFSFSYNSSKVLTKTPAPQIPR